MKRFVTKKDDMVTLDFIENDHLSKQVMYYVYSLYQDFRKERDRSSSTNGDNWTNNNGWKAPPLDTDGFALPGTENTWRGITYDTDGG